MKCHYSYSGGEKFLIPFCTGSAAHNDLAFCTCTSYRELTYSELKERVKELEKEVAQLKQQNKPTNDQLAKEIGEMTDEDFENGLNNLRGIAALDKIKMSLRQDIEELEIKSKQDDSNYICL